MIKRVSALLLSVGLGVTPFTSAETSLVRFEGGIGSQPLAASGAVNSVLGVNPGGRPWVIARLSVDVKTDGRVSVDGRGLLLGGGNGIGTTGNQSVRARLFCGGVSAVSYDSALVPLDPAGDFRIEGDLSAVPPSPCASPVLLIVNAGGAWFAAGIPKP
jgi:hypothetical protein